MGDPGVVAGLVALVLLGAGISPPAMEEEPSAPVIALPGAEAELAKQRKAAEEKRLANLNPDGLYLLVPLTGEFGDSINAVVLKEILRVARSNKCRHVVFEIDSSGGSVRDAQAVAQILESEWPNFTFHVLVKRAFSASVWLTSACDHVWVDPTGTTGAAVMFTVDSGVPSPVEARFASACAAEVVARAEAKKQPGCLYRAMMIQEAEVFGWENEGKYVVSSSRQGRGQTDVIDTETTVLSLTPREAEKFGFARAIPKNGIAGIGELLHIADWRTLRDTKSGHATAIRGKRESKELDKAIDLQLAAIKSSSTAIANLASAAHQQLARARASYPSPRVTSYDPRTGRPTGNTLATWQQAVDGVIQEWRGVQGCLKDLDSAETNFKNSVARANRAIAKRHEMRKWEGEPEILDPPMPKSNVDKDAMWREAERQIDSLKSQRNR